MFSQRAYLNSSNILFTQYDDDPNSETGYQLIVAMKWGGVYVYEHVPAKIWYGLLAAPSPGKYVWERLRTGNPYPYTLENYEHAEEVTSERLLPPEIRNQPKRKAWWNWFLGK